MNDLEKIIKLLENEYVSSYAISKLSGEQINPESIRRYRRGLNENGNYSRSQVADVSKMRSKTMTILLGIAEEVEQAQPKNKEDVQQLIQDINQSGKLW